MSSSILRQLWRMPMIGSSVLSSLAPNSVNLAHQLKLPFIISNSEQVRTIVRKHFKRPSERKRIAKHGWEARLKTPGGRAIIMRRILKGKHTLTH